MAAFTRLTAVFVGLVNLVIVASSGGYGAPLWTGDVTWAGAIRSVLAVVFAGLLTSEIVLRWFRRPMLDEKFFVRYGVAVSALALGGVLMGGLLTAVLIVSAY